MRDYVPRERFGTIQTVCRSRSMSVRSFLALALLLCPAPGSEGSTEAKTSGVDYRTPPSGKVETLATSGSRGGGAGENRAFFVGSRGWHSSITVERAAIPKRAWPAGIVERTFAGSRYVEVGWGDADFYMARRPTVLTALDAVFLPGASVLLIVGLDPPLEKALPWGGLQRVPCSSKEFDALCRAIGTTFQRDENGGAQAVGTGLYGRTSRFYAARGLYSAVHTCNHWTARMMRAGGLRTTLAPTGTWSSGAVVAQSRRLMKNARSLPKSSRPRGFSLPPGLLGDRLHHTFSSSPRRSWEDRRLAGGRNKILALKRLLPRGGSIQNRLVDAPRLARILVAFRISVGPRST